MNEIIMICISICLNDSKLLILFFLFQSMKKINPKFMKKFTKEEFLSILKHIAKKWESIRAWDLSTCIVYKTNDYDDLDDWIYLNIDLWIKSTEYTLEELPEFEALEFSSKHHEAQWYKFLFEVAENELFEFYNLMRLFKKIIKKSFVPVLQWIHFWKERIAWTDSFMLFYTDFYDVHEEFLFDIHSIHAILAHEYHNSWIKFFQKSSQIVIVADNQEMITFWQSIQWKYPEYMNDKIIPSEFIWEYKADFDEVLHVAKYMKLDYIKIEDQMLDVWYWYTAKLKNSIWNIHITEKTARMINWMTMKISCEDHFSNLVEFPNNEINWWTLIIKKIKQW